MCFPKKAAGLTVDSVQTVFVPVLPLQKKLHPACLRAGPALPYHKEPTGLMQFCLHADIVAQLFSACSQI